MGTKADGRRRVGLLVTLTVLATGWAVPRTVQAAPTPFDGPHRAVPGWLTEEVDRPSAAAPVVDVAAGPEPAPGKFAVVPRRLTAGASRGYLEVTFSGTLDRAALQAQGATLVRSVGNVALVSVPVARTPELASVPGVVGVRSPADLRGAMFRSPGAGLYGGASQEATGDLHANGITGVGVKVGIIDFFDPSLFAGQAAADDIKPVLPSHTACFYLGQSCPFGSPGIDHGNNVLETVTDAAPGADFYLAEVGTITDYVMAIDWFTANGVTIISHSLGGTFDGPGNGTGPSDSVVDYAVSKGITWINAAGNAGADPQYTSYQGGYWRGTWYDPNNNGYLNFKGTDESLGTYCGALLGLRWSDWGAARTDYDLYVTDLRISTGSNSSTKVLIGNANQAAGALPLEGNDLRWLCNHKLADGPVYDVNGDNFVSLWVKKKSTSPASGAAGDVLELMVNHGWFEYSQSAYSASSPFADSASAGMLAVGAGGDFTPTGYSSQGPTNDGRVKPDVVQAGCVNTSIDGACHNPNGFEGTSAAAPIVAGLAALEQQLSGKVPPSQLVNTVRATASASYVGNQALLPNNQVGWGTPATRGAFPWPASGGARFASITPARMLDTRQQGYAWGMAKPMLPESAVTVPVGPFISGASAVAVAVNITIVNPVRPGYVQAYPTALGSAGGSSNVNAGRAGQNVANFAIVPVGPGGQITFFNHAGGDLIVDLLGFFAHNAASALTALEPYRVYDSRCAECTPLEPGVARDVKVLGTGDPVDPTRGVPGSQVSAVMVTVTADAPAGPGRGYLSAVPVGTTFPVSTSTANYELGATVSGTAIVPIAQGSDSIRIYSSRATNVQVDVMGYFARTAPGGLYLPLTPTRFADTRQLSGSARPAPGALTTVPVGGRLGVPVGAGALSYNLTVAQPQAMGEARIAGGPSAPAGTFRSLAVGTANAPVANAGVALLHADSVTISADVETHRILDVNGWFTAGEAPAPAGFLTTVRGVGGTTPDGQLGTPRLSADGRYVAFETNATAMVSGDTNNTFDVFRWDRDTGEVLRVSVGDDEHQASTSSGTLGISADGNRVLFLTADNTIVPGDIQYTSDIFERDVAEGTTTPVLVGGVMFSQYAGDVSRVVISQDLSTIAFATRTALLPDDTDTWWDYYVYDRDTATLYFAIDLGVTNPNSMMLPALAPDGSALGTTFSPVTVWRRGVGASTFPGLDLIGGFDANGSHAMATRSVAGQTETVMVDVATQAITVVSSAPVSGIIAAVDTAGTTWLAGGGCGLPKGGVWLLHAGTCTDLFRTWNGAPASGYLAGGTLSANGEVAAFVSDAMLLRDFAPTYPWFYVYDSTP